jgi:hypothetical protein
MRKLLSLAGLILCFGGSLAFAGSHNFQPGRLLDVSTETRSNGEATRTLAVFTVQVGDIIYTLDGGRVHHQAKDYAKGLIVGDTVQASVEGENVILLGPNGKDIKTSVLKRTRAEPR